LELPVPGRPTDEEALRLVVAFYCIMETEKRDQLIALAETFAKQSHVVEGCTHFSLLSRDHPTTIEARDTKIKPDGKS
jgi:hypothetical protein